MSKPTPEEVREQVRQKYARVITAKQNGAAASCCDSASCCGSAASKATQAITGNLYSAGESAGLTPELLESSLGCGNPTALASLHAGEVVLDLGSGAGLDVILSARRVGPSGKAYGLDMTDEMLAAANANKARLGVANAEFLKGTIEEIPLPDNSVDVVISNCVINLSADKDAVFREVHRVLRPGGRLAVSDIVLLRPLPEWLQKNLAAWTGCISGALGMEEYLAKLRSAGFADPQVEVTRIYEPQDLSIDPAETKDAIGSAFIRAKKTAVLLQPGKDYVIRDAAADDFPAIRELLAAAGLTAAGVEPESGQYFVAEAGGQVVGSLGCERSGDAVLLRSFAVRTGHRKGGIGAALLRHVLEQQRQEGVAAFYLLTNTAETFAARFGFQRILREEIPAPLLASSALCNACPATSLCMGLRGKDQRD